MLGLEIKLLLVLSLSEQKILKGKDGFQAKNARLFIKTSEVSFQTDEHPAKDVQGRSYELLY